MEVGTMKKFLLSHFLLVGIAFIFSAPADAGTLIVVSSATFDGGYNADAEYYKDVLFHPNGDIYAVGAIRLSTTTTLEKDMIITRYTTGLTVVSSITITGTKGTLTEDIAYGVEADESGNLYVSGTLRLAGENDFDSAIFKLDENLNILSSATYHTAGSADEYGTCKLVMDGSGNLYTAMQSSYNGSNDDIIVVKYNSSLVFQSSATWNGAGNDDDGPHGIAVDNSGNIYLAGFTETGSTVTGRNWIVLKFDSGMNLTASHSIHGALSGADDDAYDVYVSSDDSVFVCGEVLNSSNRNTYTTVKYDTNLNVISSTTYGSASRGRNAYAITGDNKGYLYVAGVGYHSAKNAYTCVRYDKNLNQISTYEISPGILNGIAAGGSLIAGVGSTSGSQDLAIRTFLNAPPALTSISVSSASQGDTFMIQANGSNFISGQTTLYFGGAIEGINVSSENVVNSTTLTALVTVDADADLGAIDATLSLSDGLSSTLSSALTVSSLSVVSVSPDEVFCGETTDIAISGSNFVSTPTVSVDGGGVLVNSVSFTDSSTISANIAVSTSASEGTRTLTVTNPAGSQNTVSLTVKKLTVSSVSPDFALPGETEDLTITGSNFLSTPTVSFSGSGITVNSVAFLSTSAISANVTLSAGAANGSRIMTVTNPSGHGSATAAFAVAASTVTVSSISPSSIIQGETETITITGTNFIATPDVAFSGTGITVNSVIFVSSTTLTAGVTVSSSASAGNRDLTVTNAGDVAFTLGESLAVNTLSISSLSPSSVIQGESDTITITGENFVSTPAVSFSGTGKFGRFRQFLFPDSGDRRFKLCRGRVQRHNRNQYQRR